MPCRQNSDCVALDRETDAFICVADVAGTGKHCVTLSPFNGAPCQESSDCPSDQRCFHVTPYQVQATGECRVPCGAGNLCPERGGVPHVCLSGGQGGCFPGAFGLPCTQSDQCIADFVCSDVPAEADGPAGGSWPRICTIPCQTDADCDADPWALKDGYCAKGFCRLGGGPGDPCSRDQQCRTRRCAMGPDMLAGACAAEAAP